jgi:arylsulfatase A-like enzyme
VTLEGGRWDDAVWAIPRVYLPLAAPANNVVLVSLDTLRADHVSGYGYARRTSPMIDDALIARGTTFDDASTTFPTTNVAHFGIFASRYPAALPADGKLPAAVPISMLTEILRDAGWTTFGVTENGLVSRDFGFGWGFDRLVERYHVPVEGAERVFTEGRRMLEGLRDRPFFLFLHTYKVHSPYKPAPGFRDYFPPGADGALHRWVPEQHRTAFDDYDRCIREVDAHLGGFLEALDLLDLSDRTIVVLLSDHGEAFGEHVVIGHGFSPHQEAIRVPLVFRGPGIAAGHRVSTPVSLVDVMPTILELLGLPVPTEVQGRSLREALEGRAVPLRPLFFEWLGKGNAGMRNGPLKVVRGPTGLLSYQLHLDPDERVPGRDAEPAHTDAIMRYLEEGAVRRQALAAPNEPKVVSPEVHDAPRALGYVE